MIFRDEEHDIKLARVETSSVQLEPLELDDTPAVGSPVMVLGYPESHGSYRSFTAGHIAGGNGIGGSVWLDLAISNGSSGSPVIDTNGRVVGMVVGYLIDAPGVARAAISDVLRAALDDAADALER